MIDLSRVLVLSPHPDDAEIGCGGTLAKWSNGLPAVAPEIQVLVLTNCGSHIEFEFDKSMGLIGVPKQNTYFVSHTWVRNLWRHPDAVLDEFCQYWLPNDDYKPFNPTVVLCPHSRSLHQDHVVVYEEARRAFWDHATILGYETAKMPLGGDNVVVVDTPQPYAGQRLQALQCYQSQMHRPSFAAQLVEKQQERFEPIRIRL